MKNTWMPPTLAELLIRRKDVKDQGITFIVAGNKENFLSFHQLYITALAWLGDLQRKGLKPGDELVFQVEDSQTFIQFFWACILGGIIPVPVAVTFLGENAQKLFRIGKSLNHPGLLTSRASYQKLFGDKAEQEGQETVFKHVVFTDDERDESAIGEVYASTSDTIAFLQFSSGSTGNPKGVVLRNSNLIANISSALVANASTEDDRYLSWMPLTHDMGLIFFHLYPLAAGLPHFLMPTDLFIRHPLLWMQKASEHQATITGSPNFGYKYYLNQFANAKGKELNLSHLRMIVNGAEPISATLCRTFMDTMAPFGLRPEAMYPAYGLAEATLKVAFPPSPGIFQTVSVSRDALTIGRSVTKRDEQQEQLEIVNLGTIIEGMQLKITDEQSLALPEAHTGIIWIKGDSVTRQYYNNETATKAVITPDGWLNTGDTGFMLNGCLHVVGRVKDIIFVKGLNVYPHDIEQTIEEMEGMETGKVVACGVPDEETASEVIAVFVIHKTSVEKFLPLANQIRQFIAARLGLEVKYVIPVRKIYKTTSGKVKRHFFVEEFRNGAFNALVREIKHLRSANTSVTSPAAPSIPAEANGNAAISKNNPDANLAHKVASIRHWVEKWLQKQFALSLQDLSAERTFAGYGMTSFQAVALATDLEKLLATPIDTTVVFNFPTVEALANHLAASAREIPDTKTAPVDTSVEAADTRIAVVGMSCRLPGNVHSPEDFWKLLCEQRNAITEVPAERWDVNVYYHANADEPGKMYTRYGGFVNQVDGFDASFFGISPREATSMDPQQRLLLEVCWEALERAGIAPANLRGSDSGIFIGMGTDDYQHLIREQLTPAYFEDAYTSLGVERSIAAGRIAYLLDFHGPVLQLDTACSSSLLSVHQACQSLLSEECSLALAGGVNLMLSPDTTVKLCRMKALSPSDACKTFDDAADGYVRGEGCGIVVLKRLSDAVAQGDNILAVISGSAVNHDGLSNGLTAPNGVAQQKLIEKALSQANLSTNDIQYVEAHGTGTRLGDPVEVQALHAVYGKSRPANEPLIVGAVKTNIGHLEAAAGIAGLIKTVLCLQHGQIPATLHQQNLNRFIPWKNLAVQVADRLKPWQPTTGKRRGAISAFGLSGTNVHVILEEAPIAIAPENAKSIFTPISYPIVLSAKKPEALREMATSYLPVFNTASTSLADISYSTTLTRNAFPYRLAFEASSLSQAQESLRAYVAGVDQKGLVSGCVPPEPAKLVWLFTGQGSQYWNMGRELYEHNAVFKAVIDTCDAFLQTKWPISLRTLLYENDQERGNALLRQTGYTQPALFALECALAEVWKSWGVQPAMVAGHSVGEYAAAYAAGVFSLEDGLTLIAERARLMQALTEAGTMALVFASEARVTEFIAPYEREVAIAAINGPELTVISGKKAVVETVMKALRQQGFGSRELAVSHAFHSPLMEPMLEEFQKVAETISYHVPSIPLVSNVTGETIRHEIAQASYWVRHISAPVQFSKSIQTIGAQGERILLEVGPQPSLLSMAQLTQPHAEDSLLPSVQQGHSSWSRMLQSLLALHVKGQFVNWAAFYASEQHQKVSLPTYPFQRQRYWIDLPEAPKTILTQPTPNLSPSTDMNTTLTNPTAEIEAHLTGILARLLKTTPADIQTHAPFLAQGADSLIMASLVRSVESQYGLTFTIRLLFEELTSISLMARYIAENASVPAAEPAPLIAPALQETPAPVVTTSVAAAPVQPAALPVAEVPAGTSSHFQLMQRQLDIMAQQLTVLAQPSGVAPVIPATAQVQAIQGAPVATKSEPTTNGKTATPKKFQSIFPKMETTPGQKLPTDQQAYLDAFIGRYTQKTKNSKALTEKYRPVLADNRVSAGFRFATKEMVYPIVASSSQGAKMTDVDGNEYVDLTMGFGVNLLGHRPEAVVNAVTEQLQKGLQLGPQTPLAGEVATRIAAMTGMERVSFHNSGTEAVMSAMRLARTITGKNKIAIFQGSYHGYFDGTLAIAEDIETDHNGVPIAPGVIRNMVADVLVFDYLNPDVVKQIRAHAHELAAILVEPVQSRRPAYQPKALLQELRAMTAEEKVVLIFDEMITGFRIHPGGCQAHFGIQADMATYGKIIGGGLPIGVIAGQGWCMRALDGGTWEYGDESYPQAETTFLAGTFCKHPLSMAASLATLGVLEQQGPALQMRLNARADRFVATISALFEENKVPIKVNNFGSLFYFSITGNADLFFYHLLEKGVYIWEGKTCFLSTAHTDADIAFVENAFCETVKEMQKEGFLPPSPGKNSQPTPAVVGEESSLVIEWQQPRPALIPLSCSQERLWFIDQLEGSVQYHLPVALRLEGPLDAAGLNFALQAIVDRHEVLRTVMKGEEGQPYQEVLPAGQWSISTIAGEGFREDAAALKKHIDAFNQMPFNLAQDHLMRAQLIRLSAEEHVLALTLHHIVCDDWSANSLFHELIELYDAYTQGRKAQLPTLTVQYADYAIWQRAYLQGSLLDKKLAYWKGQLEGITRLTLPTDYERPAVNSTQGAVRVRKIDQVLSTQVQQLSRQHGVTLFTTLLTVFKVLLHRYSKQEDICVGIPIAGRMQVEVEDLIGFFVNSLALRSDLSNNPSFSALVKNVQSTIFDAYDHQEAPFEKVVEAVVGERDISQNPLFQVVFAIQNIPQMQELRLGEARMRNEPIKRTTSLFDQYWSLEEQADGLEVVVEYCTDLFSEATIDRMIDHYQSLLQAIVADPSTAIGELGLLSAAERQQVVVAFNQTRFEYPRQQTIPQLFAQQVQRSPQAVALVFEQQSLTYQELDERSNQVAHYLLALAADEKSIGLLSYRGLEMVIALLGILKSGKAYVPFHIGYPLERLTMMMEDAGVTKVLYTDPSLFYSSGLAVEAGLALAQVDTYSMQAVEVSASVQDCVYVMYTSGTTGRPKGIGVSHQNILKLVHEPGVIAIHESDTVLQWSNYAFDGSTYDLYSTLLCGAKLVLVRDAVASDVFALSKVIQQEKVSVCFVTTALFNNLVDHELAGLVSLRKLLFGGELVSMPHVQRALDFLGANRLVHVYGPTETTVYATSYAIDHVGSQPTIPIGKPLANTQCLILDPQGQPVPVGVNGELFIGGEGVSLGYVNNEALSEEKFVRLAGQSGRWYRTGDVGRWLSDGNIAYAGRVDNQVKMRGYRIELGEIETVMNNLDAVAANCVVVKNQNEDKKLISYYVPDPQVVQVKEQALYRQQIDNWKELYEIAFSKGGQEVEVDFSKGEYTKVLDPEFDITGWNDSFTGGAIPADEMRKWLDDISRLLLSLQPQRVLEIGCGTGLIYYQLAGHIQKYIGTDFSRITTAQLQGHIAKGLRAYPETELRVCAAHEVTLDAAEAIDTVILNSIVQYFPGAQYLADVISQSIAMLKGKGQIVVGDVRDLRLLPSFKGRLQLNKLQDRTGIKEFEWNVDQEVLKEEELLFSPAWFYQLQAQHPEIKHVEIRWKLGDYSNELSLYRYTVILHVGVEKSVLHPNWENWNSLEPRSVIEQLNSGVQLIALQDVPNPRLWKERLLAQGLRSASVHHVRDLIEYSKQPDSATRTVNEMLAVAEARGYQIRFFLDEDPFLMNVLLEQKPFDGFVEGVYSRNNPLSDSIKTNIPLFTDISVLLQKEIRTLMQERLPDYMVPSDFVALQFLPLTNNGKVDRKFLTECEYIQNKHLINYQAPATPTEEKVASIWQSLLGVERVGVHDNFFELGGHSLLATRAVSAIRKALDVDLTVKNFFLYPTIALLAVYLDGETKGLRLPAIEAGVRPERLPLSFSQERLWFIDQLEGSIQYHMPAVFRLEGALNLEAFTQALQTIVNRHEVLRTVIEHAAGMPYQRVMAPNTWQLEKVEGASLVHDELALNQAIETFIYAPFDLAKQHMLRAQLIRLSETEHRFVIVLHHIASDGWSISVLMRELVEGYRAFAEGREAKFATLPIQYADYAIWQRNHLEGDVLNEQLDYWKTKLEGVEPLSLPTDFSRPPVQSIRGALLPFRLNRELTDKLQSLSQGQGATLYMTLLAAFNVLLSRYSSQIDICVGTSIAGRTQAEVEGLMGFFVNTLALRTDLSANPPFVALLEQVKETTLGAYEHQDTPFEKVVEAVEKNRDISRTPLFQVMFELFNTPKVPDLQLGDLRLSQQDFDHTTTLFDLSFCLEEDANGVSGYVEYCVDLFEEATIGRMIGHYENLLHAIVQAPNSPVGGLKMLSLAEEKQLLEEFNDTALAYPAEQTFLDLFASQVAATPQSIALRFGEHSLTYQELDERANQLAHYLIKQGVKADSLVPLCLERGLAMVVGVLGILKAGGAYVPFDPEYPADRLSYLLEDCGARLVVSTQYGQTKLAHTTAQVIALDSDGFKAYPTTALTVDIQPSALAYVIYTSGSTGKPKGAMVEHAGMLNHLFSKVNELQLDPKSIVAYTASYTFDISVWQMLAALLSGGQTIIYPTELILEPASLLATIEQDGVTILEVVPSYLASLLQTQSSVSLSRLRYLLVTGEAVSQPLLANWFAHPRFGSIPVVNAYGPTEASDDITHHIMHQAPTRSNVPLGKPIQNLKIYVLDASQGLCPVGVPGEICVSGVGVGRGYLNNAALTAQKFIQDPFQQNPTRMYRTGDLGRWLADGTLEYLGRMDEQVKLRGYRIELGEIESVLQSSQWVSQAVVLAQSDSTGQKRLVAYLVPEGVFEREAILAQLQAQLPEYMIPSRLVPLESLPLTPNGKINKKALPEVEAGELISSLYVAPRNETEKRLAELIGTLLGTERVGLHDNLFELGMHSLLVMRLAAAVQEAFQLQVSVRTFFQLPTILELARYIKVSLQDFDMASEDVETLRL